MFKRISPGVDIPATPTKDMMCRGRRDGLTANCRSVGTALWRSMVRAFPHREILIRTKGQVRFINLSGWLQIALAGVSLAVVGWVFYCTATYFIQRYMLAARDAEQERLRLDYARIIDEKESRLQSSDAANRELQVRATELRRKLVSMTRRVRENRQLILDVLDQKSALERNIGESKMELDHWQEAYAKTMAAQEGLAEDLRQVERELEQMARRNVRLHEEMALIQGSLDAVQTREEEAIAERDALREQLLKAEMEIAQHSEARALLRKKQDELKVALDRVVAERDEMMTQRLLVEQRVSALQRLNAGLRETQHQLIASFTELTVSNNDEVEKALAFTGLDVDALLADLNSIPEEEGQSVGKGGPFIAYIPGILEDPPRWVHTSEVDGMLAALDDRVARWQGLNRLLRRLPLSAPMDQYRISSGFGKRRDPINGKFAMHYGLDLNCYPRTPVLAPASGTVAFVGWKGALGKVIEIDHGMGIVTRYGHLRKILVKKGQKVDFRQKIGIVGASGRTTGPHLHYEIQVKGKPCDPLKFIKAGKYVFRG
jgi:murein DD-endopeptidase MepM/ murein hydrolase activator NlpD